MVVRFFWIPACARMILVVAGMTLVCVDTILCETAESFHFTGSVDGYAYGVVDADI